MRPDQFRAMLREQKQVVEEAAGTVFDCDQLTSYQRIRMCSQLLHDLSLSSRKIAMTLRLKSKQATRTNDVDPFSDNCSVVLFSDRSQAGRDAQKNADNDR